MKIRNILFTLLNFLWNLELNFNSYNKISINNLLSKFKYNKILDKLLNLSKLYVGLNQSVKVINIER